MNLEIRRDVPGKIHPEARRAAALALPREIDVGIPVEQVELGGGIQMAGRAEFAVDVVAHRQQHRRKGDRLQRPFPIEDQVGVRHHQAFAGLLGVVRVLGTLDKPDRVPRVALAPSEGSLSRFQGEAGIGPDRVGRLVQGVVVVVGELVPLQVRVGMKIERADAAAQFADQFHGSGAAVELVPLRLVDAVQPVEGPVAVEGEALLLELHVAAYLERLLLERGRV